MCVVAFSMLGLMLDVALVEELAAAACFRRLWSWVGVPLEQLAFGVSGSGCWCFLVAVCAGRVSAAAIGSASQLAKTDPGLEGFMYWGLDGTIFRRSSDSSGGVVALDAIR